MFERVSDRARSVVVAASDEARALGHGYIGTEHLLLGVLSDEGGRAAALLRSCDITIGRARAETARIHGSGEPDTRGQLPFTARAKQTLELALEDALRLGHGQIDPEHLLAALTRHRDGAAHRVLRALDADPTGIRNEMLRLLGERDESSPDSADWNGSADTQLPE